MTDHLTDAEKTLAAHDAEVREQALVPIREALAGHPRCDIHPDGDSITCGWKHAVASMQAVLDADEVRAAATHCPDGVPDAEFDRWFKAHDAEVRAQALREAADWLDGFEGPRGHTSAYDRAGRDIIRLLRERAEQTKEDR